MNDPSADHHRAARVMDVVSEALERAPAERAEFLREACGGDEPLRAEVRSLLDQETGANGLLNAPVFAPEGGRLFGPDPRELRPGDTLGDCRVIRFLGEGGTGEVYLAQDTRLERPVAVKLLKRQFDEGQLLRRFHHERRVLAGLTHPNIARLYGGSTTPEGRSYLVMEYIEGERLDRYCDIKGLDVTGRLEIFRKVCAAVAYAHQNLVVHRDLKPANVRVTGEGEPKLLDFGIAKLLETEATAPGSEPTVTMQAMMTPEYASPEQLRGEAITTASDVYSLGVVLYELLTGERPYRVDSRSPEALAHAIFEQPPARPSTVAGRRPPTETGTTSGESPARLRRRLAGDLDTIVAMALRKEPARRYGGVEQFAEDIRRHLEGFPVVARKDALGYRAGKFLRRRKLEIAAAGLVVLMLLAGAVATIWYKRDSADKDRAAVLMHRGNQLLNSGYYAEAEVPCRQAVAIFENLPAHGPRLAEALTMLAYILEAQGKLDEPEGLLHQAQAIYRATVGQENAAFYGALGCEGWLHFLRRDYPAAIAEMRACDAYVRAAGLPLGDQDRVGGLCVLGLALTRDGKAAEGEPVLREALEWGTANHLGGNADPENVAAALGECLLAEKRYAEAEPLLLRGYRDLKTRPAERESVSVQAARQLKELYTVWGKPTDAARFVGDSSILPSPTP